MELTESKIKALKEAQIPTTQSELRSFLGLVTYCSKSIPDLASKSNILWKMTCTQVKSSGEKNKTRNGKFKWDDWITCLEVDASPVGAASVLYQCNPDNKRDKKIISFWSQGFSDVEQRYSQYEKEALAVILACEKHRPYLIGPKFLLFTDYKAVELVYKNPNYNPSARIRHFNLRLLDYKS